MMHTLTWALGIALCAIWVTEARSDAGVVRSSNAERVPPNAAKVSDFCAHVDRNIEGFLTPPYRDTNLLYGYYDQALGHGPVITLGSRTLMPGFRGYGLLGSPGYGIGVRPTSAIDLKHFNGGPWYHKFERQYLAPPGVNFDPGTPRRRF
ncbi:hypothetical protein [Singulisphaera acidiphila]|uniref:Uncharacterized protein n=1 Tax=Singulisphaera acidiphila (strain ATCC BAA-1392 / DSM 18658 / VKM B-2454 / MOB10) TaxID=886293 RepID=L0DP41_SINAD|nr:hypothetical protein [Singulisphaera acidiphila]AGA30585.1 hypothetical protein Sinac_6509 [Singulisphaera acidiphila DSM 18658]